jgi:hypothetical protein
VDGECTQNLYAICQLIAQRSDNGRKALIEQNILPVVIQLTTSQNVYHIDNACSVLKALAHSGIYRSELINAGVKAAMERITRSVTLNAPCNHLLTKDFFCQSISEIYAQQQE